MSHVLCILQYDENGRQYSKCGLNNFLYSCNMVSQICTRSPGQWRQACQVPLSPPCLRVTILINPRYLCYITVTGAVTFVVLCFVLPKCNSSCLFKLNSINDANISASGHTISFSSFLQCPRIHFIIPWAFILLFVF